MLDNAIPDHACAVHYGNYVDLKLAKLSCAADHDCLSVIDAECDTQGPFQLCMDYVTKEENNMLRCIYNLKEDGKNVLWLLNYTVSYFISIKRFFDMHNNGQFSCNRSSRRK